MKQVAMGNATASWAVMEFSASLAFLKKKRRAVPAFSERL